MELNEIKIVESKAANLQNYLEIIEVEKEDNQNSSSGLSTIDKNKLKELESIIEQKVILEDDAKKFKAIWHELAAIPNFWKMFHSRVQVPWDTWAALASKKSRFDIVMLLFNYVKWKRPLHKIVYLIRYCPNEDYYNEIIESALEEVEDQELKDYRYMNLSVLDLSYGVAKFPKPYIVEILFNRGMNLQDMHTEQGLMIDDPECLRIVLFNKGEIRKGVKSVINKKDEFGCTALHRAAQRRCQKSVQYLLEADANFGTTNNLDESCISQIDPELLEEFFNVNCIKTNNKSLNDKELILTFDYRYAIQFD